jgi:hypothetical protein
MQDLLTCKPIAVEYSGMHGGAVGLSTNDNRSAPSPETQHDTQRADDLEQLPMSMTVPDSRPTEVLSSTSKPTRGSSCAVSNPADDRLQMQILRGNAPIADQVAHHAVQNNDLQ